MLNRTNFANCGSYLGLLGIRYLNNPNKKSSHIENTAKVNVQNLLCTEFMAQYDCVMESRCYPFFSNVIP
jgi:hypothetical protein